MAWPNSVRKADLKITYYRGSGPGGQNKNKRDTACRMKHLPTGITVTAQEMRTQGQNRKIAFGRLAGILVPMMKRALAGPEREISCEVVRTYREVDNRVRDKRLEGQEFGYEAVLDGDDLDAIIQRLLVLDPEQSDEPAPQA